MAAYDEALVANREARRRYDTHFMPRIIDDNLIPLMNSRGLPILTKIKADARNTAAAAGGGD
jgi:hypothetical protein